MDDVNLSVEGVNLDILALDEALHKLGKLDSNKGQLVELRFFGGLSMDEISHATGTSLSNINREWRFIRAWLYRELSGGQ